MLFRSPDATLVVVGVLLAIWLVALGLVSIVSGFSRGLSGGARSLLFIAGAIILIAGLIAFRGAVEAVWILAVFVGIGLVLRSISMFVRATEEPGRRGWSIFAGIIIALLAIAVFVWPDLTLSIFVWIVGIILVISGVIEVIGAFFLKSDSGE